MVLRIGTERGRFKPARQRTSMGGLYVRQASPITWSGNVPALVKYVRNVRNTLEGT